jgi:hypothetical protein
MSTENPFRELLNKFQKPEDEEHYAELGRFITAFAHAENSLHILARRLSGMSDTKARTVFGGMNLNDLVERVRAMMLVDNIDKATYDDIDVCLVQLKIIAERRHRLVHRSSMYLDGRIVVTNVMTAKSLPATEVDFEHIELSKLLCDCLAIGIRLGRALDPSSKAPTSVYAPWKYKPAPIKAPKQTKKK